MLAYLALIIVVFWIVGVSLHIAGNLIHLALLVALVMFILHLIRGRNRPAA